MRITQIKSTGKLTQKLQRVFNEYIRLRDKNLPCISCGSWNQLQAGHFYNVGHYSWLRFNEENTNNQCIRCNLHLHGNLLPYRENLIKKIGAEKFRQLEIKAAIRTVNRYARFNLELLINYYKEKIKNLK